MRRTLRLRAARLLHRLANRLDPIREVAPVRVVADSTSDPGRLPDWVFRPTFTRRDRAARLFDMTIPDDEL